MKNQLKPLAITAALIAGIVTAPTVFANEKSKTPATMMKHGGMMAMMKNKEQMNKMMETCSEMMKGMTKDQRSDPSKEATPNAG